jgi:hypothetical protein
MGKKLVIKFTNKWLYTFALLIGILALAVGVYAVVPSPGHAAIEIEPPAGCSDGEFLQWRTGFWGCAVGAAGSPWVEVGGNVYRDSGRVGVGVASPVETLHVAGGLRLDESTASLSSAQFQTYLPINIGGEIYYLQLYKENVASPPAAPTNLVATPISSVEVDLTWSDNSNNENEFRIERALSGGAFSQIGIAGADTESYDDFGLLPDTLYEYRVRACNAVGCSSYAGPVSARTLAGPPGP